MEDTSAALLPIHPKYASSILQGDKLVEFRKKPFKRNVAYILIYVSSPVSKIVGYFEVGEIQTSTPEQAWKEFSSLGAIDLESFNSYYENSDKAVTIKINKVFEFPEPIELQDLDEGFTPPQSYRYVSEGVFRKALNQLEAI